jgi:hypothetical protein
LPLIVRNYAGPIVLDDAPDLCEQAYAIALFPYQYIDDFETTGDIDWYSFNATQGVSYTIQTNNVAALTFTSLMLYTQANQCAGEYVLAPPKALGRPDVLLGWQAPTTGKYSILVYESYGQIGGNYTLYIQENP